MIRKPSINALLLSLAVISGSCGGCSCTDQGGTDLDAAIPDAWVGSDYVFPDMKIPDTRRPDTAPPVCGGERKVTPIPITRGTGYACGKGCKQVTFGEDVNEYDVAGDLLVYSGGVSLDREVYLVNLKTDQEWLIHKAIPKTPGCFTVATDGQKVAYTCSIWPNPYDKYFVQGLYLYDPLTMMEKDLQCWNLYADKCSTSDFLGLGTQGAIVTMSFTSNKALDAFFYRFSDKSFINISQRFRGVYFTHIYGDYAVWTQSMDAVGGKYYTQIMLYDTVLNSKQVLATHDANQYHSRIKGDRVVWVDNRNSPGSHILWGNSDIYLHDIKTKKTTAICTQAAQQNHPDVEGNRVVWEDWRNNPGTITPKYGSDFKNSDIYLKDLNTDKEHQITSFPFSSPRGLELKPRIDGNRVFFTMIATKTLAVFMIDLKQALGR